MLPIERKIATNLIKQALTLGWLVSINDGEETTIEKTIDFDTAFNALATTGEDYLIFHNTNGEKIGTIWLVWGNGEDLITDTSDQPDIIALCDWLNLVHMS